MPNLHMLIKQKSSSIPRNQALGTFGNLLIVFSAKINLLYLLYATAWRCCLDNSGICLPIFSSRTYLKLHNIFVAPKIVKKVITNLDSSEVFGPDFLLVVVLKNCEPEVSYILAALFNMCLKESCFPDCCKVGCPCF